MFSLQTHQKVFSPKLGENEAHGGTKIPMCSFCLRPDAFGFFFFFFFYFWSCPIASSFLVHLHKQIFLLKKVLFFCFI